MFEIVHLDSSLAKLKEGIDREEHWKEYPYADPKVHVLEETSIQGRYCG